MGSVGLLIIVAAVVVVLAVVAVVALRRRRDDEPQPPAAPPRPPRPEPAPMTGLEDALNRATDRSGTTMADRLDAERDHVDELRVTDDTGPLLRRALDKVDHTADAPGDPATEAAAGDDPHGDGGAGPEPSAETT